MFIRRTEYAKTKLPLRLPKEADHSYGYSFVLSWICFVIFLGAGCVFLFSSHKRKADNLNDEFDDLEIDEPVAIRRWLKSRYNSVPGRNFFFCFYHDKQGWIPKKDNWFNFNFEYSFDDMHASPKPGVYRKNQNEIQIDEFTQYCFLIVIPKKKEPFHFLRDDILLTSLAYLWDTCWKYGFFVFDFSLFHFKTSTTFL